MYFWSFIQEVYPLLQDNQLNTLIRTLAALKWKMRATRWGTKEKINNLVDDIMPCESWLLLIHYVFLSRLFRHRGVEVWNNHTAWDQVLIHLIPRPVQEVNKVTREHKQPFGQPNYQNSRERNEKRLTTLMDCTNIGLVCISREQFGPNSKFIDPYNPRIKVIDAAGDK